MLEKFFSSIGFEGAEVKTYIQSTAYTPGDTIIGTICVTGGQSDQEIKGIELTLFVTHDGQVREDSDFSYYDEQITQVILKDVKSIKAGDKKEIPFELKLTANHPLTTEKDETFIQTKVLVLNGVDPKDKDIIHIK
ncbi:hypothetical protein E2R51_04015 [Jeotgalibacillus sp. S-D1]|uniref:sporulation protein n=1 Tax=Jeotgalibacillus sp. S-D1 TaxID=2552189 RepID=UPI001059D2B1|nr:sporulation protein [Jeotgalibacillus sp. S-D1]TDL34898.1 hypothetical protein E2R51_04015 [Jeotgalibacillus sp. S-D1]